MAVDTTKWVQILYTLFMGQPIKKSWYIFYDFLSYYFYKRVKEKKQLPNEATLSWIYGEFLWWPEISAILQNEFFDVKEDEYEKKLREFRKRALKEIVTFIDPDYPEWYDYDMISLEDISYFFQQIAKTKIWWDEVIRKNEALIRELANAVSRANFDEGEDVDNFYISNTWDFDDIDWMNPELPMTKAFEYLEKENRKKYVLDEFKPYVDALDLTAFKRLLKDPLKRHFLPRWWQAEFLLRHKRFNRIWASRRAGKCRWELELVRLANWEFKMAKDIVVWDKLLSSNKLWFTTVRDTEKFQKECVRVTLSDWTDFVVSKDHRIPTQKTYKNWKRDFDIDNYTRAENLTEKDFVPTMNNVWIEWEWWDFNEWMVLWLLLWDWCLSSTTPTMTCKNQREREVMFDYFWRLWFECYEKTDIDFSIKWTKEFRERYWLYWKSRDKKIDNKVFWMSKAMKRWVVSWLIFTDWYLWIKSWWKQKDWYTRKAKWFIEYCTVSERLAKDLRILLADLGIISSIKKRTKKTKAFGKEYVTDFWFVYIYNNDSLNKIRINCHLFEKKNYDDFIMYVNEESEYENWKNSLIPLCAFEERTVPWVWHQTLYWWIRKPRYDFQRRKCKNYGIEQRLEYNWCRVVSVEDIGIQNVVHIEVDWDHTYWGEMDLTHNTFLWAWYLAGRQLMLPMQTVVYVVPTLKNHARPAWKALSHYFWDCTEFKMNKSDFSIVNKETKSEMYFVTAERWDSVRWAAANMIIYDEASFFWEDVYETSIPLIRTTRGMVYWISTVNPKTPKNWFYYKLIEAEINNYDPNSESYARRIDLWHNPFIPEDEKQLIAKDWLRNPAMFNCEWMVNFADKDSFDLSKFWIIDEDPKELTFEWVFTENWRGEAITKEIFQTYPTFILSYDWAKRKDKPGISVYWVKPTWWIDMVMSWYIEWLDYYTQVDVIYAIFQMLWWEKRCELLMDYWWAWVAVHEIFVQEKNIYPIRLQTVGWMYEWKEDWIYKVWKELLVWLAKAKVSLWDVRWYSFMKKLSIEFETYTDEVKRDSNLDNHWDIISSMMFAIYRANKHWYLEKKEPTKAQQAWDWEFAQYNNPELFSMSPNEVDLAMQNNPYERYERFWY